MEPKYPTFIHQRNALSRAGKNPHVIRRMPSGWAVMGDDQFLTGYSLLVADPEVDHLTDLDDERRVRFLLDMSLLGEAVFAATPAYRINYEILGNSVPALHAHVWPRFADEPKEFRLGPVGRYPRAQRTSMPFSLDAHSGLLASIGTQIDELLTRPPSATRGG
jgi:diadenosine tetraphosphate (Ap4A) HIT family hydrolase